MNFYNIFIYTVPFITVLSLLIFVHEFGHYIVARFFDVKIEVFSIGFGKAIKSFRDKNNTLWVIACIPFGGYVKMFGDSSESSSPDIKSLEQLTEEEKSKAFFYKKPWQKILIALAGPLMNFALAVIILFTLFMFNGHSTSSNIVSDIAKNSAAEKAGIAPGDKIISLNGKKIKTMNELRNKIILNDGTPIAIEYERNNKIHKIQVNPDLVSIADPSGKIMQIAQIGIMAETPINKKLTVIQAINLSFVEIYTISTNTLKAIKQIIYGKRNYKELGGPIHIANSIGYTAKLGIIPLLWFTAMISANIALINLLPIPTLDGGHVLYYFIEILFFKKIPPSYQNISFRIGMLFLIALFIFVTFNDLKHFFLKAFL